jgi:hypothetical protein
LAALAAPVRSSARRSPAVPAVNGFGIVSSFDPVQKVMRSLKSQPPT